MATYNTSEFRSGLKLMIDGDPYTIVENEIVKGKVDKSHFTSKTRNISWYSRRTNCR